MLPLYEETAAGITVYHQKSRHAAPHLHHSIEFVYITEGELALGVGQELHPMAEGDLAVVFPGLVHHYQVFAEGRNTACHIVAAPALAPDYWNDLASLCPRCPVLAADTLHPDIPYAIRALREDFGGRRNASGVLTDRDVRATAQALVTLLLSRCFPHFELTDKSSVGSQDLIYRTVSYVSEHFLEPMTLTSMAHDLGVSPYALSRIFSGTFHRNFNQYLNEFRLDYACTLLRHTDRPVTDICFDAGFESQRTFNRCFQAQYHMSPRAYRAAQQQGGDR